MNDSLQHIFNKIYINKKWGNGSGVGSSPSNVIPYIQFLSTMIERYNIKSIVDLGCGNWEFSRLLNWDNIQYLGVDVSNLIITKNQMEFEKPNIQFLCGEIFDVSNIKTYDLIIIKDVLQHLDYISIFKILQYIKNNQYLLITNDIDDTNENIVNGDWKARNMTQPPFNLISLHSIKYFVEPKYKECLFIKQNL